MLKENHSCRFGREEKELQGLTWRMKVADPEGNVVFEGLCPEEAVIENPRLWWPNGYGSQPLYQVDVALLKEAVCWIPGADGSGFVP